jgi:type II secretory pathway pseudopilin PulG
MIPAKSNPAFTLVEMLVSIAVLVMLAFLIMELFNSATATATLSRKHIDADEEARAVLDRMGSDLARMVKRPDVNYIFYKNNGAGSTGSNDAMFFYSEGPGYISTSATSSGSSTMSLVGFRINPNNPFYSGIPVMERLGENLTWGGTPDATGTYPGGMVYLPNPVSALFTMTGWTPTLAGNWTYTLGYPPGPPYVPQSAQYDMNHFQLLSDMVFRMEFCFLLKSGTYALPGNIALTSTSTVVTGTTGYSNAPTAIPATLAQYVTANYLTGAAPQSAADLAGNVYGFPADLGGIVVTIAVLDNTSRKLLPVGGLSKLGAALNDSLPLSQPSGINATPGDTTLGDVYAAPTGTAQIWQSQIQQSGFAHSLNIPQTALDQVRVYERTFYLDAN